MKAQQYLFDATEAEVVINEKRSFISEETYYMTITITAARRLSRNLGEDNFEPSSRQTHQLQHMAEYIYVVEYGFHVVQPAKDYPRARPRAQEGERRAAQRVCQAGLHSV